MPSLQQIVTSKKFKTSMGKVYGWGAAVVILGAMFKIQHWPFASIMLVAGLGTEAFIFFMSAFEPPHAEPDWSLVYPELAGMYDLDEEIETKKSAVEELDNMLADAKIGPELIESLGTGLRKMSENAAKMSDVTDAHVATQDFIDNVKVASTSVVDLTSAYKKTAEGLVTDLGANEEYVNSIKGASLSANKLASIYDETSVVLKEDLSATEAYVQSIKGATNSANELADKYTQSAQALTNTAESLSRIAVDEGLYKDKMQEVAKNLTALNAVYELQIQGSSEQLNATTRLQEGMNNFVINLNESIQNTQQYKDQAAVLVKNVAALNNVYGNMLAAMNVKLTD